ncbi:LysR family transcriptional regulator [Ralstonia flaminis]|jgi:DNA-binding transcriptional LysR family regulator|uniref:HTH-type transcriptional activator CmpR n=1 Tax=Ralstonia flaminis TaxID=3058597 RepID=A0ABM9KD90_9RALS|nr:LysR family transcriptional regulator [Ralstonia sp. LMG 18101]CAJ0822500.1 HTH-type transcriptional activator CmpR [Ralstonia sp. LMG 18101]
MELYQLKAVLAVARTGQLARAAEQLHLTQSAISKQIKGLEDELGVLLFDRTPTGMPVTAAGRRLLPIAGRVVDATQEMAALASSLRGNVSGVLRLGTIIDPESIRLGPLLAALLQFYPHIDVTLAHGISGSVLQMLRDGQIDAGFYLGTLHDPEITVHPLAVEHYVVVAPAAWEAKLRGASLQELAAMPWLATPAGSSQHGMVAQMFAERGLSHNTVVEADQEASMIELVQSGVALGIMRERLAAGMVQSGQAVIWDGARLPCPLCLLHRRASADNPMVQALLATLPMIWQPEADVA